MRSLLFLLLSLGMALQLGAQDNYWMDIEERNIFLPQEAEVAISVKQYRTLRLEQVALQTKLDNAPMEFTPAAASQPSIIRLPLPDGRTATFEVVESPVMAPELAAKYPELKAYAARGTSDPQLSARFDVSPYGFHAIMHTPDGLVLIEPYATRQSDYYLSYYAKELEVPTEDLPALSCGLPADVHEHEDETEQLVERTQLSFRSNETVEMRKYRMALACTGEYAEGKGGTVESVMASFNTSANLLNGIYINEIATRFELIPDNDQLAFLDPETDPYENTGNGGALLSQNVVAINSTLEDFTSYDIGHLFNGPAMWGVLLPSGPFAGRAGLKVLLAITPG